MTTAQNIPGLVIEFPESTAAEQTVLLQQEFGGSVHQVELHKLHVRMLAERLGIVPTVTAEAADMLSTSVGQSMRFASERGQLQRALLRIESMAEQLHENLRITHDNGHEDLTVEIGQAVALVDFVEFFCESYRCAPSTAEPPEPECKALETLDEALAAGAVV
ncbi:hypothetical protein QTI51_24650 [Variovorax sp. J22G73]|uniref:hypothetical protein n=1 Tax=unclassified Variovorax TaxID=663243 RepID=UPI002577D593|nr:MULTISPECIES: hypothetical protein [unclassified Variovorax]MDM0007887.1 hypothetical protein [Variovorax sp. J22R203]MDM0100490.1 hypothetical protein [Variovorax sp. J22G73]